MAHNQGTSQFQEYIAQPHQSKFEGRELEFKSFYNYSNSEPTVDLTSNSTQFKNKHYVEKYEYNGPVTLESICSAFSTKAHADEPSIFEEMEINPSHIYTKGLAVLKLGIRVDKCIMDDTDLAGPIFFLLLFGGFLLMSGKAQVGYIYTFSTLGWVILHSLFNLMSPVPIKGSVIASVLGYCLLPVVFTCFISVILRLRNHLWGFILSLISSIWCTYSASSILSTVLQMHNQKALVAYPLFLFYSIFALLATS